MNDHTEADRWESVDPSYLELIGKVIVRFSELEGWVAELVRHYSGTNEAAAYALTGQLRMRGLLEALPNLVRATRTNERLHADIDSIRLELIEIARERDKIAHWTWVLTPEGWQISKWLTARSPQKLRPAQPYPRDELQRLLGQMTMTLMRIHAHLLPDDEWRKMAKEHRDRFWPSPWREQR